MEFRTWVETRLDDRILERELVSPVERPASGIGPEEIGLTLEEGKTVLRKVQARIVQTQVDMLGAAHRGCFRCGDCIRLNRKGRFRNCLIRITCSPTDELLQSRAAGAVRDAIYVLQMRGMPWLGNSWCWQ